MQETFHHPEKIRRDHFKYTLMRVGLWLLIGIPFWVFGTLMAVRGDGYAGLVLAIVFTVIKSGFEIFFHIGSREFLALAQQRIELDGRRLRQVLANGDVAAVIDLDKPFAVDFVFTPLGQAIYNVTQDAAVLKFSARLNEARRLVGEILGHPAKWPPEIPQPESAASRYHRQADPEGR